MGYVHVCIWGVWGGYVPVCMWMWRPGQPWVSSSITVYLLFETVLLTRKSWGPPVFTPPTPHWDYKILSLHPAITWVLGDPNSSPHTYTASTLPCQLIQASFLSLFTFETRFHVIQVGLQVTTQPRMTLNSFITPLPPPPQAPSLCPKYCS